ncbi:cytidylyltransferase, partial [Candidatus Omnitrophota bacterium]
PPELATDKALGEDSFQHGYFVMRDRLLQEGYEIELVVLLFCNAPMVLSETIDKGVSMLRDDEFLDSTVTVSKYNMWSPLRARREKSDGLLEPFVPFEVFGDPRTMNCDRDSQGDVWFADMGLTILSPVL